MKLLSLILVTAFSSLALADIPVNVAVVIPESNAKVSARAVEPVADHRNIFTSGLRGSELGSGITFAYQRILGSHLALGGSFAATSNNDEDHGGSLDVGQYYKEETKLNSTSIDLIGTYYFRENGYGRWGFLLRGGVGHSWNKATAKWGRYDRNPAVIIIGGDDKRLREEGSVDSTWGSTYARLGAYYQFVWGFKPTSRLGHILELGVGGIQTDQGKNLSYVKPNGEYSERKVRDSAAIAEISYSLAF